MQTITIPIVGFIKSGKKKIFIRKDRKIKVRESQLDHIRHTLAKADGLILDKIQNDKEELCDIHNLILDASLDLLLLQK